MVLMPQHYSRRMAVVKPNAIGELLKQGADPGLISFAGGYPDPALFPAKQMAEAFDAAIHEPGGLAMQYTVADGPVAFREQIAVRMRQRGVTCSAENVLVLQGSQQGLDLIGKMLLDPGDIVITESPTFLGAKIAFDPNEPRYAGVRMDQHGMDMNHLETVLKANPNAKFIYTIPDFQNPTGVTLTLERRKRLMELANVYDLIVVEDTAYRELRFEGEAVPTLKSLDTEGRVILLGSFSKILVPGLRLGWAVAAPELIEKLGLLKLAADTQTSTLNMAAASVFMQRNDLDAHVAGLRVAYRRKRDVMLDAMRQHFPQEIAATEPVGGLFTWLTFPRDFDTAAFMRERSLPFAKVAYVPGATFFPTIEEHNHARFNYSGQSEERIAEGMKALGKFLKEEMTRDA
jgi:2-aminoadipate transaminase